MLIHGAIKTKKSQCAESQRNKTVLSSRLNSVRQMSCCRSSTGVTFVIKDSLTRDLQSFEIQIWIGRSDSIRNLWADSKIFKSAVPARPLLIIVKWLRWLMALSGTVYGSASSMSDRSYAGIVYVCEDWNEESVVPHISFVLFVTNYWLLNARFDSYSVGPSWNVMRYIRPIRFQFES